MEWKGSAGAGGQRQHCSPALLSTVLSSQHSGDASLWLQVRFRAGWRHSARQEELRLLALGHRHCFPGTEHWAERPVALWGCGGGTVMAWLGGAIAEALKYAC